jgi:hypothetical protein
VKWAVVINVVAVRKIKAKKVMEEMEMERVAKEN